MLRLKKEIESKINSAERRGMTPAFRLNGTSDIKWEKVKFDDGFGVTQNIFEYFPDVQFYDYTKVPNRGKTPEPNYSLTYSRSENNDRFVADAMEDGQNIAVVFGKGEVPDKWTGPRGLTWPVLDGDYTDLRFLDKPKRVVGLSAKGKGAFDTSGFVLYGNGVLDMTKLDQYKNRALRDPSIIGQRKIGNDTFVPIQSKVNKKTASATAELLRQSGRRARVVEHKPTIGGRKKTAFAVYTPGVFARNNSGAKVALIRRSDRIRSYQRN
tara:strand:+ start:145 stop:948 length:804 start_codon:yes stop_codon:yes gene_type:complete